MCFPACFLMWWCRFYFDGVYGSRNIWNGRILTPSGDDCRQILSRWVRRRFRSIGIRRTRRRGRRSGVWVPFKPFLRHFSLLSAHTFGSYLSLTLWYCEEGGRWSGACVRGVCQVIRGWKRIWVKVCPRRCYRPQCQAESWFWRLVIGVSFSCTLPWLPSSL